MSPSIKLATRFGLALLVLTLPSPSAANRSAGKAQGKEPKALTRTVDQISYQVSDDVVGKSVLFVDQEGQLCHKHWKEKAGRAIGSQKVVECFGYSVNEIAGQSISQLIPEGQVATQARVATPGKQRRILIVISWGFDRKIGYGVIAYNLYVFDASAGIAEAKMLHKETTLDRDLLDFRVANLDSGDEREILEVGRSGRTSALRIRRVAEDGSVVLLQKLEADEILIANTPGYSSPALVLLRNRVTSDKCPEDLVCYSVSEYRWSTTKSKFVQGK